ncbi:uncharacterized protein LOC132257821 [Phlebotomus argentipes]|uniref:uncharacterized protein LOC132257821 n=1 Tax=Phlebotomus argentipes TaxID=94469 RepID=UPI002892DD5A|nr:uncharacterized protein LOC132257821 [Phlebotomus argentipes]
MIKPQKQSPETSHEQRMRILRAYEKMAQERLQKLKKRNSELKKIYKQSCKLAGQLNLINYDDFDDKPPVDVRAFEEFADKIEAKLAEVKDFEKKFKEEVERLEKIVLESDDEEEEREEQAQEAIDEISEVISVASSDREEAQQTDTSASGKETEDLF